MKAIVLAAGEGTRMKEATNGMQKVLYPVCGRPFLSYVIDNLKDAGFYEIGIVVGHKKEQVDRFAAEYMDKNPEVSLTLMEQPEQSGTASATLQTKDFVGDSNFISLNGDNLYSVEDLKALRKYEGNCIAALEVDHPERYGVVDMKDGKLVNLVEKPENPPSNCINAAAYVFTPEIFDAIGKIEKSSRGELEITDAISLLAREGKVDVHVMTDYWMDFGRPEDIQRVETFLCDQGLAKEFQLPTRLPTRL